MQIAKNLTYFFILPALLSIAALGAIFAWSLHPGIDLAGGSLLQVTYPDGRKVDMPLNARIDTADEIAYFKNGGILHHVLRHLAAA